MTIFLRIATIGVDATKFHVESRAAPRLFIAIKIIYDEIIVRLYYSRILRTGDRARYYASFHLRGRG